MNNAYRLVWNESQQAWVPAPEYARAKGKSGGLRTLAAAMALISGGAFALPTGGQISAGQGSIAQAGSTTLNVSQQSQNLSVNWNSFNIGASETVNFQQPNASAIVLNRILGTDPSAIYGHLNANGQVFLLNPNGVLFGQGAQVNVGGLVASTLNLTDKDFLAGNFHFTGTAGSVVNQGSLTAADGGYIALLGGQVSNSGTLSAKLGTSAGNYSIASGQTTTANITAKSLTIGTLTGTNKVYDGTTAATATGALTGVVSGDSVTAALTGTFASKNAGSGDKITIKTQALSGTDAGNYTLSNSVVNQTTSATITPKALSLTGLSASNKVYNASTAATVSATLSGVVSGDSVGDTLTAAFSDKNVGTAKTVTVTGATLSGTSAANYSLATGETCTANITPAALTITANNDTIKYSGTPFSGGNGVTYSGFVGGETSSVLSGVLSYSGSSQGAVAAGSYVIAAGGLSNANYTITYVNGTLVINP